MKDRKNQIKKLLVKSVCAGALGGAVFGIVAPVLTETNVYAFDIKEYWNPEWGKIVWDPFTPGESNIHHVIESKRTFSANIWMGNATGEIWIGKEKVGTFQSTADGYVSYTSTVDVPAGTQIIFLIPEADVVANYFLQKGLYLENHQTDEEMSQPEKPVIKDGWNGNYYYKDGNQVKSKWIYDNEYASWYYLTADGTYAHDTWVGAYYLKQYGDMAHHEWIYDNHSKDWFFINEDGTYAHDTWIGSYYLTKWGAMAKDGWAYSPTTGWHFFNSDGTYVQNQWVGDYYLKQWGYMAKNEWIYDKGAWYYAKDNGQIARNEVIDGYQVDASGKWKK